MPWELLGVRSPGADSSVLKAFLHAANRTFGTSGQCLDLGHAVGKAREFDGDDFKAGFAISLFVNPLESQSLFVSDPARVSMRDEAEVSDKEHMAFENM